MGRYVKIGLLIACAVMMTACGGKTDEPERDTKLPVAADKTPAPERNEESSMILDPVEEGNDLLTNEQENPIQEEKETEEMDQMEVYCPKELCEKREGVTYGTVEHITYHSETTGLERGANVLLPAGYSEDKEYPVLYFQHGIFGDENGLVYDAGNAIPEILGNLVAEGKAREMIVVFPNMYATTDPEQKPDFNREAIAPYDNFINDLTNDLIPYIESHYSALTDRENRAILGFSMGGRETLYIGINRPDLFAYIGAISPAPGLTPGKDRFMEHVGQMAEEDVKITDTENRPKLLMVCCGSNDSVVGKFPLSYHTIMEENGVEHMWYEVPGADHDNTAIKSGFYNFLIRYQ